MERFQATKLASYLGMGFNLLLFIIKFAVSILSSSQAMMADAINSLGDILSSLMTFIGNKISSKPRDQDHNLGHGKAEYIYSLLISILLIVLSFSFMGSSFQSIFIKKEYTFSYLLVVVCILTILIKLFLYLYTNHLSKNLNSLLLKANAKDHLYDAMITLINLFAIISINFGIYAIDGIVGVGISFWILWNGIQIFKESYDVLMDKTMEGETKNKVVKMIKQYPEVKRIGQFIATPVGYQYQISFTIYVDGNLTTYASHKIANQIEHELKKLPEIYLVVIHVNPI